MFTYRVVSGEVRPGTEIPKGGGSRVGGNGGGVYVCVWGGGGGIKRERLYLILLCRHQNDFTLRR